MPSKPLRPCRRCFRLPVPGSPFCADHRQPTGWDRHTAGRTATERGYGPAWRHLRNAVLLDEPWCRLCDARGVTTPATTVDHIVPKAAGGTDARSNLRGLCRRCHATKTGGDRFHGVNGVTASPSAPRQTVQEASSFESASKGSWGR